MWSGDGQRQSKQGPHEPHWNLRQEENSVKVSCVIYLRFFGIIWPPLFFFFLGLHLQHMEISSLGVKSELQLPAYATATETPDPSCIHDLCHSSWQHQILNPLSKARDWTPILKDTMSGSSLHWGTRELQVWLFRILHPHGVHPHYLQWCTCNLQINTRRFQGHLWAPSGGERLESPMVHGLGWGWTSWPSTFWFLRCPLCDGPSATFSQFCALGWWFDCSGEPSAWCWTAAWCFSAQKTATCLMEKIMLDRLQSGMSYTAVGCELSDHESINIH